jgi:hypothetical protein
MTFWTLWIWMWAWTPSWSCKMCGVKTNLRKLILRSLLFKTFQLKSRANKRQIWLKTFSKKFKSRKTRTPCKRLTLKTKWFLKWVKTHLKIGSLNPLDKVFLTGNLYLIKMISNLKEEVLSIKISIKLSRSLKRCPSSKNKTPLIPKFNCRHKVMRYMRIHMLRSFHLRSLGLKL